MSMSKRIAFGYGTVTSCAVALGLFSYSRLSIIEGSVKIMSAQIQQGRPNDIESVKIAISSGKEGIQIGIAIAIAFAIAIGLFNYRGMRRAMTAMADSLSEGAGKISEASTRLTSVGRSLSSGAGDATVQLVETGGRLERINSMTRSNAETSGRASALSTAAMDIADRGNAAMNG
jgi:methyl-accepting chemotaxis protein